MHDENWWVRGLMERENLKPLLPTALSLRKEAAELLDKVAEEDSEQIVREMVADLNERILDSRRRKVDGPDIWIRTFNVDRVAVEWRQRRATSADGQRNYRGRRQHAVVDLRGVTMKHSPL